MPIPLLFISGAGLPAWIWDDVRSTLPPGQASAVAARPPGPATLAHHSARTLLTAPWPRFAIVAHSIGGVLAAEISAHAPDRVAGVLGVAATFPSAGQSFLRAQPLPGRVLLGAMVRLVGTTPPASVVRSSLGRGLPRATMDRIVSDLETESRDLFTDAVSANPSPPAVRWYLRTDRDRELPPKLQEKSARRFGASVTRSLPTGHLPMLERPLEMGGVVADFVDAVAVSPIAG
jgi:pimeloyl-ACP methyl ester carboxylesterase